jgi:glycosyltransferase involved in cell wall biosynthesis
MTPPADRPLRILHIFRAPVGGLFRYVLDVARGQIARGHQVGILCDSTTGGVRAAAAFAEIEPSLALGVHRIPITRNPGPADLKAIAFVRRLVREQRPDIIHGHGSKGGLLARFPAFFDRNWPACVFTSHGGSFHFLTNSPRDCLYRGVESLMALKTDMFLMESAYIEQRIQENIGPLRQPVRIVHHGVTPPEFEPVPLGADPFDLLYLGEMRVLKGVDILLEALAILKREGKRVSALLIGAGPDEQAFHALTEKYGLLQDVSFDQPQPIRQALGRARVIVIPSRGESLSYVALESAAAAMPMIATGVGGIPEIFGPYAGRLIPPSDVSALAGAISGMLAKTEEQRRAEAAEVQALVRTGFSYDGMVDGGLAAYRAAIACRAG